jgi:hypothetical protein
MQQEGQPVGSNPQSFTLVHLLLHFLRKINNLNLKTDEKKWELHTYMRYQVKAGPPSK